MRDVCECEMEKTEKWEKGDKRLKKDRAGKILKRWLCLLKLAELPFHVSL